MKTKELISAITRYEGLYVKDMGDHLEFKEVGSENAFYTLPKWAVRLENGHTNLRNINKAKILSVWGVIENIRLYLKTPLDEREEPKQYRVKFPGITRGGHSIYLARNTGNRDPIGIDWSPKDYIVDEFPDDYIFTEQEIKDINVSYWEFAEEVKG